MIYTEKMLIMIIFIIMAFNKCPSANCINKHSSYWDQKLLRVPGLPLDPHTSYVICKFDQFYPITFNLFSSLTSLLKYSSTRNTTFSHLSMTWHILYSLPASLKCYNSSATCLWSLPLLSIDRLKGSALIPPMHPTQTFFITVITLYCDFVPVQRWHKATERIRVWSQSKLPISALCFLWVWQVT